MALLDELGREFGPWGSNPTLNSHGGSVVPAAIAIVFKKGVPTDGACVVGTTSVRGIPDEIGENQEDVALDLWPEIPVAARSVMADVEGFRKGVLLALHHRREVLTGTLAELLGFGDAAIFPKRATERSVIQLIQNALFKPIRVSGILNDRGLPGLDSFQPLCGVEQGFPGDFKRLPGFGRIVLSEAAPPARALAKFNLREIPGKCEGNARFRARSNLNFYAERRRGALAGRRHGPVAQFSVG